MGDRYTGASLSAELRWIHEYCHDWPEFCRKKGFDPDCLSYGAGHVSVTLPLREAASFGLLEHLGDQDG